MIIVYVLFLGKSALPESVECEDVTRVSVMFGPVSEYASAAFRGQGEPREIVIVWGLLILMIIFSTINNLANVGINVSVERDWSFSSFSLHGLPADQIQGFDHCGEGSEGPHKTQ